MSATAAGTLWQSRDAASGHDATLKAAIVFAVLGLTLLDRFGLRLLPEFPLPPPIAAMYVLAGAILLSGRAEINTRAALAFVAVVAAAGSSLLVNTWFEPRPHHSVSAWMLVILTYAPFAITLSRGRSDADLWRWTMKVFVAFALVLAFAGIAQFLVQFVSHPGWLFDYTAFIPEALRGGEGWRTVHPVANWVQSDGYWMKSNGFFLREPSIFSVAMALGIVCELCLGARRWALAAFAAGLLLSYSGTGLICLAVAMAFPLGRSAVLRYIGLACAAALAVFLLGDALQVSYTVQRVAEFGSESSSAHCRFVYPWLSFLRHLDADAWSALLGHGPGSMTRIGATCADMHEPTYGKLLFEYGLLGAVVFGAFVVQALNRAAAPLRLRVALGVTWLLLGGHLVNSEALPAIYLLCAMWPAGAAAAARR